MNSDLVLLIVGAGIGFLSTVVIELIRQSLERWRKEREREYEERHLRQLNLRDFIDTDKSMKSAPLAWPKLITTTTVPSYLRQGETKDAPSGIVRFFSRSKKSTLEGGKYRFIQKIILGKTQLIGRQDDCEISVDDPSVSRLHAIIRYDGDGYILYDMGSTAGTLLNGKEIESIGRTLQNGDTITLGKSSFVFESTFPRNLSAEESGSRRGRPDSTTIVGANPKNRKGKK